MTGSARREPERSTFLVEHYWLGVTTETFAEAIERLRREAERLAAGGVQIRLLHSTLSLEDEAAFCVLEAGSREIVELAYREAGVRFERIVDSVEVGYREGDHAGERGRSR